MNTKNTWGLVAAAAALFAFIFFVERPATRPSKPVNHKLLPGLQVALISRIEINYGTNQVTVERTNDTWRMVSPVTYPAMQYRIKDFLDRASKLVWTRSVSAADLAKSPHGLVDYGLQPPLAQFTLVQNNQRLEVKIGEQTLVDGQRYVQVGDEVLAYLVDERIGSLLPANANAWRDTAVLPQNGLAFNRIEVHVGLAVREFQRDETNQLWRMTKPIIARADNARIKDWLQQLRVWNLLAFVDNPAPTLDTGLNAPDLTLALAQGTNEVFGLQFGNHITNNIAYARRSQHSNVVVVADQLMEPLRTTPYAFRDRRLLTFPPAAIDVVQVQSTDIFTLQRHTNGTWHVSGQTNFAVDTALVNEMLFNLNGLDVMDFVKDVVTDWTPYGLDPVLHRYQLFASGTNPPPAGTNTLVAQLDVGSVSPGTGTVFASRPDEASVYSISNIEAQKLPRALYQIRDRRVWNFTTNEVKQVIIEQAGNKRDLVKNAKGLWTLAPGSQGIVNSFAVEETLFRLGELRAVKWLPRGPKDFEMYGMNRQSHAITLVLERDGKEQRLGLRLGSLTPNRNVYATVLLDGAPAFFELPQALQDYLSSYLNAPPPPGAPQ